MKSIVMQPIGIVHSTRKEIEDDNWDREKTSIEVDRTQFSEEALRGLSDFSHVIIIFYMDKLDPSKLERAARHPRNNPQWPSVGIFAQRTKNRPNQMGVSVCKIVEIKGLVLTLEGLDAIDETPVLDIKPWVAEFAPRGAIFQPRWISELMREYWRA